MNRFLIIAVLLSFEKPTTSIKEEVTPNVVERIALLKQQIADEIIENQRQSKHLPRQHQTQYHPIDKSDEFTDNYEYFETENQPVTPIMDNDDRKEKDKFKLKKIKPTSTSAKPTTEKKREGARSKHTVKRSKALKPKEIFYRKVFDERKLNTDLQWTHCQDLITPFLVGHKTDITVTKRVTAKDNVVLRLIHLLDMNTTGHSKEDIYSIMYQISNLQLRFFQWDVTAIKLLFNVIIKDQKRTFRGLKHGLKAIFANWHLDIGNITNLLKQARIFRPPCIRISDYDGSTKTPKGQRLYTKSTTKKECKKDTSDYDDECVKKTIKY